MKDRLESYKDLIVWQKSVELVINIYRLTRSFPKEEMYGITSQMRRCAVAIPSNIAEGYHRNHIKEYIQFLYIAKSSASELETQLIIVKKLDFAAQNEVTQIEDKLLEILKMLSTLVSKLKEKSYTLHPIP